VGVSSFENNPTFNGSFDGGEADKITLNKQGRIGIGTHLGEAWFVRPQHVA